MISVIIADDHHLVRQGLRALLEKQPDLRVVGEAQDGQEAFEMTQRLQPDVLLLDINMPLLNGIEVTRKIRELRLSTQVVIVSMYSDESLLNKALRSGARGYLLKKSVASELVLAIQTATKRMTYMTPELGEAAAQQDEYPGIEEFEPFDRLTPREREVCQLIAEGCTNARIAEHLHISIKTVEKHRANLMNKLGIDDMASLIREAIRHGVVFVEKYDPE
jgi:DNA-binding NarL/FixJ family response regulator